MKLLSHAGLESQRINHYSLRSGRSFVISTEIRLVTTNGAKNIYISLNMHLSRKFVANLGFVLHQREF